MVMQPVGPLPASTYWRRRGVLLLVVLLVLLVGKSCVGGGDSPKKKTSGTPKPAASATVRPTTSAKPTVAATTPPPVTAIGTCKNTDLKLTGTTDLESYKPGTTPRFTLSIQNVGAAACNVDLGTGAVELLVFSGAVRQWSSDDCNSSKGKAITRLAVNGKQTVTGSWPGSSRSKATDCNGSQAGVGTYTLRGRIGTLQGQVAVFHIVA
jgi:hypothetical protein